MGGGGGGSLPPFFAGSDLRSPIGHLDVPILCAQPHQMKHLKARGPELSQVATRVSALCGFGVTSRRSHRGLSFSATLTQQT
jgi:hypothetical protein